MTEWLALAVSVLALVLSTVAFRSSRRTEKRAEAELVHPLMVTHRNLLSRDNPTRQLVKSVSATVTVINNSATPVSEVHIEMLDWDWRSNPKPLADRSYHALRPNSEGEHAEFDNLPLSFPRDDLFAIPPVQIRFRTSQGRWRRDPAGRLSRFVRIPIVAPKGRWSRY